MRSLASHSDLTLAIALACVALILLLGFLLGSLMRRFRQPTVIGEITAGIILGPSALGLLPGDITHRLFTSDVRTMLSAIAQMGLLLFVFKIGWEFDRNLLLGRRAAAAAVSVSSIVLSFMLGAGLAFLLYSRHSRVRDHVVSSTAFAVFLGAAMAVTAFPVLARILADNRMLHTTVGALALASAAIDDLLAWCLLALVSAIVTAGGGGSLIQIAGLSIVYVALMFLVVRPVLAILVRRFSPAGASPYLLGMLAAGVFVSSYATTLIGIHAIFGAFLFGIIMPRESADTLQRHVRKPLDIVNALLLPVFFVVTGLGVNIGALSATNVLELVAVIVVACAGKFIGAAVPARVFGMPWRQAGTLGLLMNTRGLTELIILNAGLGLGVLDTPMFTMMTIMALFTTALAGPLLPRHPDPLREAKDNGHVHIRTIGDDPAGVRATLTAGTRDVRKRLTPTRVWNRRME
jgi:Kef-type K+ transport system membrane component KefB